MYFWCFGTTTNAHLFSSYSALCSVNGSRRSAKINNNVNSLWHHNICTLVNCIQLTQNRICAFLNTNYLLRMLA